MSLKIRLTRIGSKHRPVFRLAVVDSRSRRDGRPISVLGYYNPTSRPHELKIEQDQVLQWLHKGAQPTETARSLLQQTGVWQRYQLLKQGKPAETVETEVAAVLERRRAKSAAREAKKAGRASAKAAAAAAAAAQAAPEASA